MIFEPIDDLNGYRRDRCYPSTCRYATVATDRYEIARVIGIRLLTIASAVLLKV
jgi:hypothetical protein